MNCSSPGITLSVYQTDANTTKSAVLMPIHARRIKTRDRGLVKFFWDAERFLGSRSSFLSTLVDLCSLKKEDSGTIFNEFIKISG